VALVERVLVHRMHRVLVGMRNRTPGPYLAATIGIPFQARMQRSSSSCIFLSARSQSGAHLAPSQSLLIFGTVFDTLLIATLLAEAGEKFLIFSGSSNSFVSWQVQRFS
jgi:hypothetical protein